MSSERTCHTPGKVAYKNRGQAERALKRIKWSAAKSDKKPVSVYPCESGKHWHLTSQNH